MLVRPHGCIGHGVYLYTFIHEMMKGEKIMILLENVEKNSYVEVAKVSQITEDYYSSDGTKKAITLKLFTNEDQTSLPVTKKRTLLEADFGDGDDRIFVQLSANALLRLAHDLNEYIKKSEAKEG